MVGKVVSSFEVAPPPSRGEHNAKITTKGLAVFTLEQGVKESYEDFEARVTAKAKEVGGGKVEIISDPQTPQELAARDALHDVLTTGQHDGIPVRVSQSGGFTHISWHRTD